MRTPNETDPLDLHAKYIARLVEQGGPKESQYGELDAWLRCIHRLVTSGQISLEELATLRKAFGDAFTPATLQGFAYCKPHGYAGDFEIVDRIYQMHVSPDPRFSSWDLYWHQHAAPKSHRNRKQYFYNLLNRFALHNEAIKVLELGAGPGRCIYEWFTAHPSTKVQFHCVDIDLKAIAYATKLNHEFLDRVTFQSANVLRYRPDRRFDLIWSGGLFDYFPDRVFVSVVRRLLSALNENGELVISNYSDYNPSIPNMMMIEWEVQHRTESQLEELAKQAGALQEQITIGRESEGVNFFLHIRSASSPAAANRQ